MKRTTTIALFAGVFAVAMGTLGLSGVSSSALMVSPDASTVDMLGHVEYTVLDETGKIKHYMQTDNDVVQVGKDCAARAIFDRSVDPGACPADQEFQYIAIGNNTGGTIDDAQTELSADTPGSCANATIDGEMARKPANISFVAAGSGTGTDVVLQTNTDPFNFDTTNATAVIDSGIFNGDEGTQNSNGSCATLGTTEMFAIQQLSGGSGITVSDGDSLSVKWTITVG